MFIRISFFNFSSDFFFFSLLTNLIHFMNILIEMFSNFFPLIIPSDFLPQKKTQLLKYKRSNCIILQLIAPMESQYHFHSSALPVHLNLRSIKTAFYYEKQSDYV